MATASVMPVSTDTECPICMTNSADNRLTCVHSLCKECYDSWFNSGHATCPMCRTLHWDIIEEECPTYVFNVCENHNASISNPVNIKNVFVPMTEKEHTEIQSITCRVLNSNSTPVNNLRLGNVYATINKTNTFIIGILEQINVDHYVLSHCICMLREGKVYRCTPTKRPIAKEDDCMFYRFQ